jgi:hypothetical protein
MNALLNLEGQMPCECGAAACRKELEPHDTRVGRAVRAAFRDVGRVEQPPWAFVRERDELTAAARGEREVPSCGVHLLSDG